MPVDKGEGKGELGGGKLGGGKLGEGDKGAGAGRREVIRARWRCGFWRGGVVVIVVIVVSGGGEGVEVRAWSGKLISSRSVS